MTTEGNAIKGKAIRLGAVEGGAIEGGAAMDGAVTDRAPGGASAPMVMGDVTRAAMASVEPLIRPFVRRTPVVRVDRADFGLEPGPLVLKLEHLQHSGSFKVRGAFANLLLRDVPAAGVVAASGGNHGAAVAYAAMMLRKPARIFVPEVSSPAKIARIRGYGADLVVSGDTYADALAASEAWIATSGAMPVHAYDQTETMLGAGSLAIELEGQAADTVTVMAGVGGGGLLAGVAAWYAGRVGVVGVEPEGAPTLTSALRRPPRRHGGGQRGRGLTRAAPGRRAYLPGHREILARGAAGQ